MQSRYANLQIQCLFIDCRYEIRQYFRKLLVVESFVTIKPTTEIGLGSDLLRIVLDLVMRMTLMRPALVTSFVSAC